MNLPQPIVGLGSVFRTQYSSLPQKGVANVGQVFGRLNGKDFILKDAFYPGQVTVYLSAFFPQVSP